MQVEVVTAKFLNGNHGYYFSPNGFELHLSDLVIVDTEKGKDIVKIVKEVQKIDEASLSEPLKNVIKIADKNEIAQAKENREKANSFLPEVKKMVADEKLDMKVISVESNYNFSRLTINFTADNRVDFRDLVKKLAEKYKTKIELRQVGPRDTARILGGLGPCGMECCCHRGFDINDHVSIKMAKNQGLSLNPSNISGLCGKMLCCLGYENYYYAEILKKMPKINATVKTKHGVGKVIYNDVLNEKVCVKFEDENSSEIKEFEIDEVFVKSKGE